MERQLNLFNTENTPLATKKSLINPSDYIFQWFLNQIDIEIKNWIWDTTSFINNKNSELADYFIKKKRIQSRIPRILEKIGFRKDANGKFPQYWFYYKKIRKHIINQIRTIKIKLSQENELKKLTKQASGHNSERVAEILSQKWGIEKRIRALKLLVARLTIWNNP